MKETGKQAQGSLIRRCLLTLLGAAGAASMLGGTCGDPSRPVLVGGQILRFGVEPDPRLTRLDLGSTAPFQHWGYRGEALNANAVSSATQVPFDPFQLASFFLDDTKVRPELPPLWLFVEYGSSGAYWFQEAVRQGPVDLANQHLVLLFARDPQEQTDAMRNFWPNYADLSTRLVNFPGDWNSQWVPTQVPNSATFVYPPKPNFNAGGTNNDLFSLTDTFEHFEPVKPYPFTGFTRVTVAGRVGARGEGAERRLA